MNDRQQDNETRRQGSLEHDFGHQPAAFIHEVDEFAFFPATQEGMAQSILHPGQNLPVKELVGAGGYTIPIGQSQEYRDTRGGHQGEGLPLQTQKIPFLGEVENEHVVNQTRHSGGKRRSGKGSRRGLRNEKRSRKGMF